MTQTSLKYPDEPLVYKSGFWINPDTGECVEQALVRSNGLNLHLESHRERLHHAYLHDRPSPTRAMRRLKNRGIIKTWKPLIDPDEYQSQRKFNYMFHHVRLLLPDVQKVRLLTITRECISLAEKMKALFSQTYRGWLIFFVGRNWGYSILPFELYNIWGRRMRGTYVPTWKYLRGTYLHRPRIAPSEYVERLPPKMRPPDDFIKRYYKRFNQWASKRTRIACITYFWAWRRGNMQAIRVLEYLHENWFVSDFNVYKYTKPWRGEC
jgi:hypothetical protein